MIRRDLQLSKNLDSGGVNGVFGFIGLIKPFPKKLRKVFSFPISSFLSLYSKSYSQSVFGKPPLKFDNDKAVI